MLTIVTASAPLNQPAPMTAISPMASRMAGKASTTSIARIKSASSEPFTIAGDQPERHADRRGRDDHGDGGAERDAGAVDGAAEEIAPEIVGAEEVGGGRGEERIARGRCSGSGTPNSDWRDTRQDGDGEQEDAEPACAGQFLRARGRANAEPL